MIYKVLHSKDYESYCRLRERALDLFPEAFSSSNEEELATRKMRFEAITNHRINFIMGTFAENILTGMAGFITYGHEKNALNINGRFYDEILMVKFKTEKDFSFP